VVLKKMFTTTASAIEFDRISGKKAPHYCGDQHIGDSHQQVKVIGHQCPRKKAVKDKTLDRLFLSNFRKNADFQ
jgi:hypothetical protein